MNINQSKPIDPIANMRNSNKVTLKAQKDLLNQIVLRGTRMVKKTSNKFLAANGKMVEGNEKIKSAKILLMEARGGKSKGRKRSKNPKNTKNTSRGKS